MKKLVCMMLALLLAAAMVPALAEEASGSALVACFSCTGNTMEIAELIAGATGAELFEIVPETPYTEADLDHSDGSRANQEQADSKARPAISGAVENMDAYTTIYLGYPIWFGDAPRIISTFLESYDLSGKTIVPFCTSGRTDIGGSVQNLRALCPDAVILDGARLNKATAAGISEWLDSLA